MNTGILIADDSASVRRVLRDHFTKNSVTVCGEADTGEETIEKARILKPDLIILDLAMPGTNGYVAASVLKEILPHVRIVLFTMYSEAVGRTFGTKGVAVDAIVAKSDGIAKLMDCIQGLLGTEQKHPSVEISESTTPLEIS
jgi:DNA-binding NarL/FixJ family response regulator